MIRPVCAWEVQPDGGTRALKVAELDQAPGQGAAYRWCTWTWQTGGWWTG
ncbi:MAG: hypothetical protein R3E68_07920 [Burkholderiaceae bacterium]